MFVALSPHFVVRHSQLVPHLHLAPLLDGPERDGYGISPDERGAAYLPSETADALVQGGECFPVDGAPTIEQPVFATFLSRGSGTGR